MKALSTTKLIEVTEIEWEMTIDKYAKEIGWEIGTSKERALAKENSND